MFPGVDTPTIVAWGAVLALLGLQNILTLILVASRRRRVVRQVVLPRTDYQPPEQYYAAPQPIDPRAQRAAWKAQMAARNGRSP